MRVHQLIRTPHGALGHVGSSRGLEPATSWVRSDALAATLLRVGVDQLPLIEGPRAESDSCTSPAPRTATRTL
jgi:hypothetical protein